MTTISKEELEKIAKISNLQLNEQEVASFTKQVSEILSYAACVKDIAKDIEMPSNKPTNIFREDVVEDTNKSEILDQAPEREQDYFVVPKIIQRSK